MDTKHKLWIPVEYLQSMFSIKNEKQRHTTVHPQDYKI